MRNVVILIFLFAVVLFGAYVNGDLSVENNLIWRGKADAANGSVNDDDCTGEQGWFWYDSTDSAFEFCNANSGTPTVLGGGASSLIYSCSTSTDATTPANTSATLATCTIGANTLSVGDTCKWEALYSFTDDGDATGVWGGYPTLNGTTSGDALMSTSSLLNTEVNFAAWGYFSVDSTTLAEFFGNGQSEDDNFGANAKAHGTVDIDTTASMSLTFRGVSGGGQAADTIRFDFGSLQCWTAD